MCTINLKISYFHFHAFWISFNVNFSHTHFQVFFHNNIKTYILFQKYVPSEQRKTDQKTVDDAVVKAIGKRPDKKTLRGYLKSAFGLRSSQYPHRMKF